MGIFYSNKTDVLIESLKITTSETRFISFFFIFGQKKTRPEIIIHKNQQRPMFAVVCKWTYTHRHYLAVVHFRRRRAITFISEVSTTYWNFDVMFRTPYFQSLLYIHVHVSVCRCKMVAKIFHENSLKMGYHLRI